MEKIFDLFLAKELSGEKKIKEAYSAILDEPICWIECEDISIQQLVDRICDNLEKEGLDLETTPTDLVRKKFANFDIKVKIPQAYIDLYEAKKQLLEVYEVYTTWDITEENKSNFRKHLQRFDSEMEKLKYGKS